MVRPSDGGSLLDRPTLDRGLLRLRRQGPNSFHPQLEHGRGIRLYRNRFYVRHPLEIGLITTV